MVGILIVIVSVAISRWRVSVLGMALTGSLELELEHVMIGCAPRGSCNNTLLRRVLRRFFKKRRFLEGFEGASKGF